MLDLGPWSCVIPCHPTLWASQSWPPGSTAWRGLWGKDRRGPPGGCVPMLGAAPLWPCDQGWPVLEESRLWRQMCGPDCHGAQSSWLPTQGCVSHFPVGFWKVSRLRSHMSFKSHQFVQRQDLPGAVHFHGSQSAQTTPPEWWTHLVYFENDCNSCIVQTLWNVWIVLNDPNVENKQDIKILEAFTGFFVVCFF